MGEDTSKVFDSNILLCLRNVERRMLAGASVRVRASVSVSFVCAFMFKSVT